MGRKKPQQINQEAGEHTMNTQNLLSALRKCIDTYSLIRGEDRIAVGLSGGKDSTALLYGLSRLRLFYPKSFSLIAIIVDPGFHMDYSPMKDFADSLGVELFLEKTDIFEIAQAKNAAHSCSLCANMRRAALVAAAEREGCTSLALGHHLDDYLSTCLMSLIYEGRFYTFAPKTAYEDRQIQVIRPMLYLSEGAIANFVETMSFPTVKNRCPLDHATKREEMKQLLYEMNRRYPGLRQRLLHAVETSEIPDWTAARASVRPE